MADGADVARAGARSRARAPSILASLFRRRRHRHSARACRSALSRRADPHAGCGASRNGRIARRAAAAGDDRDTRRANSRQRPSAWICRRIILLALVLYGWRRFSPYAVWKINNSALQCSPRYKDGVHKMDVRLAFCRADSDLAFELNDRSSEHISHSAYHLRRAACVVALDSLCSLFRHGSFVSVNCWCGHQHCTGRELSV